jgi:hypothetical protein
MHVFAVFVCSFRAFALAASGRAFSSCSVDVLVPRICRLCATGDQIIRRNHPPDSCFTSVRIALA